MPAAYVPMEIYQGEDFVSQIVWTDEMDEPHQVVHPCRLDIKSTAGALQLTLETPATELPAGEIPTISLSNDIGMIQLYIEDSVTAALVPGQYKYDIFVTVDDGGIYAGEQRVPLMYGPVNISKRTTVMT